MSPHRPRPVSRSLWIGRFLILVLVLSFLTGVCAYRAAGAPSTPVPPLNTEVLP